MKKFIGIMFFILGALTSFTQLNSIHASEAIFISENRNEDAYVDGMVEALSVALGSYYLGHSYSHLQWLVDKEANRNEVLSLLENLKDNPEPIDLYNLTHGYPNQILLHEDTLEDFDLQSLPKIQKLRTVYMMNCYGDSLSDDFMSIGAHVTLGRHHSPDNMEAGINFPYDFPFFMNHYQKKIRKYWGIKNWRRIIVQVDESNTVQNSHDLAINDIVWISELIQYSGMEPLLKKLIPPTLLGNQKIDFSEDDVRRATKTIRGNAALKITSNF